MAGSDDGDVRAAALDVRLAERDFVEPFRHAVGLEQFADVVAALGFEEDDRIGAAQCGVHQAFSVVRGGWKDDLESWYVGAQTREILGMLSTVFRTDRDADDHRHRQHARTHGLPLGKLVENLVARAPEEIAVHQFGNDTTTA